MSYDVMLQADLGGTESVTIFERNHTSNTSQMWREAGCDIAEYDGRPAPELANALTLALVNIVLDMPRYRAHEPGNGWGTVETTIRFLSDLLEGCRKYPLTVVAVSR